MSFNLFGLFNKVSIAKQDNELISYIGLNLKRFLDINLLHTMKPALKPQSKGFGKSSNYNKIVKFIYILHVL